MAISRSKEKVRDGYLGDLPPDIQKKVMEAHKLVVSLTRELLNEEPYSDLKDWVYSSV